ncbi:hypothetical protein CcI156_06895 [Frankia sp. CcI156]|uniref:hypothetical protein n=1 Tax=unclassified Frankia TaxID=2632575 RepID=UPI0005548103|nr:MULTISPECIES: hypothetical protein [unclassified Frankia]OFB44502.1 hypothetical protein Manayef4_07485 [Frankia sp. CgIM4]OHV47630.1 hypothetical protein CgIS1_06460 [Frankia sp. CgIS1]ONH27938.1 hypothetical protein CcI156_06895 [Frankia sp. CcI156]TFE32145.1 hypothetical protein E0F15_08850 [Frankia sp. B2]
MAAQEAAPGDVVRLRSVCAPVGDAAFLFPVEVQEEAERACFAPADGGNAGFDDRVGGESPAEKRVGFLGLNSRRNDHVC